MALSFPTASSVGEIYRDGSKAWIWNGSAWNKVESADAESSDTAPTNAVIGNTWLNTNNGILYYYDNSGSWVQIRGNELTADDRPDFSADGHNATATEAMLSGGTNLNGNNVYSDVVKFQFTGTTDATEHGNLTSTLKMHGSASNGTSAFVIAGHNGTTVVSNVQKIAFSTNVTAASHGSLSRLTHNQATTQDAVQSMNAGGIYTGIRTTEIEKMAFATGSSAVQHGNLTMKRSVAAIGSDGYQALQAGGHAGSDNGGMVDIIEKWNFGSNTTTVNVGNLATTQGNHFGASDSTDLMIGGGTREVGASSALQKISFASGVESVTSAIPNDEVTSMKACSDGTEAWMAGGVKSTNTINNRVWKYNFSSMARTAFFNASGWSGRDPLAVTTHAVSSGGA